MVDYPIFIVRTASDARDLLATLRRRELEETATRLSAEMGLAYQPAAEGDRIAGMYRQRVTLSSGRFAMIDDGLSFQLVPWPKAGFLPMGQIWPT